MIRAFGNARFSGPSVLSTGPPPALYPGAIAGNSQLVVAVNQLQTTLAATLAATDTSMTVANGSGIVASCLLSIDSEIVQAISGAGNVWQIGRAFDGTAAALHLQGAAVSGMIDAWHHNALLSEITAIETFLGPNGSNLPGSTVNGILPFPAQTPGGSLVVGNNSITLSPVPKGVNGTDLNHYLYVSGGTGTAEGVLITGGSAVAGASTGQLIIQCANTHSGAWTIQTATGGIQEAIVQYPATHIVIPRGRIDTYAPIFLDTRQTAWLSGSGMSADNLSGTYLQLQHPGFGFKVAPGSGLNTDNRIVIEQMLIRGADAFNAGQQGIYAQMANGLSVRDVDISTMGGIGINLDKCYSCSIQNVIATHCYLEGLQIGDGCINVSVRDSMIASNSRFTNAHANIRIDTSNYTTLTRVDFSYAGTDAPATTGSYGLFTLNAQGVTVRDCYVEYSTASSAYFGPGTLGVLVDGTYVQDGILEFDAGSNFITLINTRFASYLSKPTGYIFDHAAPANVVILSDVPITAGPFTKTLGSTGATVIPTALAVTGSGTPALGANCPASVLTAPYTWIKSKAPDNTTIYLPAWK